MIDASNVESSYPALRRIPTTRVSARLSFGGGFRRLTLRRVAHLIVIVGVSAGIDRFLLATSSGIETPTTDVHHNHPRGVPVAFADVNAIEAELARFKACPGALVCRRREQIRNR